MPAALFKGVAVHSWILKSGLYTKAHHLTEAHPIPKIVWDAYPLTDCVMWVVERRKSKRKLEEGAAKDKAREVGEGRPSAR